MPRSQRSSDDELVNAILATKGNPSEMVKVVERFDSATGRLRPAKPPIWRVWLGYLVAGLLVVSPMLIIAAALYLTRGD